MQEYKNIDGVPDFIENCISPKSKKYCVLIPIINEGNRIINELQRAKMARVADVADIIICDGGSTDGCTEITQLKMLNVNTLLVKTGIGKQGAQLRMGIYWALRRCYDGIVTIDGNDKDSIEDVSKFINKLEEGYDMVQGSRFVSGGVAVNTPLIRYFAVRLIHAPVISLTAGKWFTDTTNAYRCYSRKYLEDERVQPLRDVFIGYELLAYLSVRADQLGYKTCEIPVKRIYPKKGKIPTKISAISGNANLLTILFKNLFGCYNP